MSNKQNDVIREMIEEGHIAKQKPDCYKCKHRNDIPGDAHSECGNRLAKVRGNDHGVKHGWFFWPFNFDPVWLEECDGFEELLPANKEA